MTFKGKVRLFNIFMKRFSVSYEVAHFDTFGVSVKLNQKYILQLSVMSVVVTLSLMAF